MATLKKPLSPRPQHHPFATPSQTSHSTVDLTVPVEAEYTQVCPHELAFDWSL